MQFFKSLSFKIGVIIILVEVVVLALAGAIYLDRFSNAIDRRIEGQVMLPASLINSGVLSLVSLADQKVMHQLVGEELLEGWAVDEEGDISASFTEAFRGQNINNLPDIDSSDFDFAQPQTQVIRNANDITSITPITAGKKRNSHAVSLWFCLNHCAYQFNNCGVVSANFTRPVKWGFKNLRASAAG